MKMLSSILNYKLFSLAKLPQSKKGRLAFFMGGFLLCMGFLYWFVLKDLPSPTKLNSSSLPQSTQIFDRNQKLLYTIYSSRNQTFVPLSDVPKSMQQAMISIEDKDFYRHGAIDLRGIARSLIAIAFKGELQGGSTITQQLVKNTLLTPDRTIQRKIKEVILAFAVELLYSKEKILEMYLNQAPFGGTAWGVESAAQTYFEKRAKDLSLAESALLAGLTEAPTLYSPFGAYPKLAKKRQTEVLNAMKKERYLTQEEEKQAITQPLAFRKIANAIEAPHFVLYVKDLLVQKYGQRDVEQGGLKVTTSLDLDLQKQVQLMVASEVAKLKPLSVGNSAALVLRPKTGELLAMVGSKDYFDKESDGNVNVTLALRQPGSAIKPINYAVGLIKGYTAGTPFVDQKTCFPNPGKPPYCPVNYDGKWHGVMQMRFALANSINIPAVKMLQLNGVEDMIATASSMGISTFTDPARYGLSLTLGGGEVSMLELTKAYGVLANSGYRVDLHPILKVEKSNGEILEEYKPPQSFIFGKRAIPAGVAFIISSILSDNGARELAFGEASELKIGSFPVAVKTGTTNDLRDNWTIGYTPDYVVSVWVGNNDNTPMGNLASGVTGAAPIWHDIMQYVLKGTKPAPFQRPVSIVGKTICSDSGLIPPPEGTPDRCSTRFEYFIKGTEPTRVDPGRQKVWIDRTTNDLAKSGQTDNVEERTELVVTDSTGDRYCLTCPHPLPSDTPL